MVDSVGNILNQLGGNSSGINTRQLVNDLVALERAPQDQRLDNREARLEAQISGIGYLRSAMSALQSALLPLANPETFDAKQAAIPDTNLMAITKLGANAVPGNYRLSIEQVAQSHSLSSGTFESLSAPLGQGTLNLRLGSWTGTGEERSFSADESKAGATIEIDSSNNTLAGVRDAINGAGLGVQASIVGQNGNYQLLLTSPTGATNELEITVDESSEAPGLAAFASENLEEHQSGRDAEMRVNGFLVSRESNTITDVIDGVEFDIFNAKAAHETNINIPAERSLAEAAIRNFVEAYNTFYTEMQKQVGFDVEEGTEGALRSDSMARNLMQSVRSMLSGAVPGIDNGFNTLANLGIRTQLDGTLQIVEDGDRKSVV